MADYHKESVEYFQSAAEIGKEEDLIETDIVLQGWSKKLRIRALDFGQMARITEKSTNDKGEVVERDFILQTLIEGIIRPKITQSQASVFLEKNGELIKQLSDEIWGLGRISKKVFDEYIATLKAQDAQGDS